MALEDYFQTVMSEFLSKIKTKETDEEDENGNDVIGVDRSSGMISHSGLLKNASATAHDKKSEKLKQLLQQHQQLPPSIPEEVVLLNTT